MSRAAEHRMIRYPVLDAELAKPPICQIDLHLGAQLPLRADRKHVAHNEHPDHQYRVDRGATGVRVVPHDLIEQTIQLRARDGEAFENSLTAMCTAVCDTFRPVTAAEFVEILNKDIRSEIELGKSIGREFAGKVQELRAAFPEPVAAQN